jgi:hypothetical protein
MTYIPGGGGGGSIATSSDVALNNPADGEVLTFDSSTSLWQNAPVEAGNGAFEVVDLTTSGGGSAITVNMSGKNDVRYFINLNANLTITISNLAMGANLFFRIRQATSGTAYTVTLAGLNPALYPDGTAWIMSSTFTLRDEVSLMGVGNNAADIVFVQGFDT